MYKVFHFIVEVIAWVQIVASPFLIGSGIGAIVYFSNPTTTRLVIGTLIALIGLIVGILWATKIWKTSGTSWFMSRIMATPDLDRKDKEVETEKEKP